MRRVETFLHELANDRDRAFACGTALDDLFDAPFEWREGWEYTLEAP